MTATVAQLEFIEIVKGSYRRAVEAWHSTLPHVGLLRLYTICYGAFAEGRLVAVAGWSRPVARLAPAACLELRRFAIGPDAPRNTGSRFLAWMGKDIAARFPRVAALISYQDPSRHGGMLYKAAGWSPLPPIHSGPWHNRPGRHDYSRTPKVRWTKELRP